MLRALFIPACLFFLTACGGKDGSTSSADSAASLPALPLSTYDFTKLEGTWGGDFGGGGDLRIVLRHISGRHAVGYNIHQGLRRNISGPLTPAPGGFEAVLSEPGDNPYDGTFRFTIDTATLALRGTWTPAKTASNLKEKSYTLSQLRPDTSSESLFNNWGTAWTDSLGDFDFAENGLVTYRFYGSSGRAAQQYTEVRGNWQKTSAGVEIFWPQNAVFQERRMNLRVVKEDEYGLPTLSGAGRELSPAML